MLNKLQRFVRTYDMIKAGDHIICAVSGGADSMALLFAMKLLSEKLDIQVSAAHFNHHLRGEESDRDAAFVAEFCKGYEIPLYKGEENVVAGRKGLEAAARDARYAFFKTLPGIVVTAHTADDNTETVLMNLIRGTGLKGLGGIAPVKPNLIRPMLSVTRNDVMAFLQEYHIPHIEDSSNATDDFLRNRVRHHIMPLLKAENPRISDNTSDMALRLRDDEALLSSLTYVTNSIADLQKMGMAQRKRCLSSFLQNCGVKEPEAEHIGLLDKLVFSNKPSAKAYFPNGVCISRNYDKLEVFAQAGSIAPVKLNNPGITVLDELGICVYCGSDMGSGYTYTYYVDACGDIYIRSRQAGDRMCLSGGSKTLKRLFIDRKIPASTRDSIPVVSDSQGVLVVPDIGINLDRKAAEGSGTYICIKKI